MVARHPHARSLRPGRRPSVLGRLLRLSNTWMRLPWRAWITQPGRRQHPLLLNPVQFSRHWRVVQLERCLELSSSTAQRR